MRLNRGRVGVAISTTADPWRMRFLETCVVNWQRALRPGDALVVTVDGTAGDVDRVARSLEPITAYVYQVGQPLDFAGKQGVAVNKNTGLELLMDQAGVEHLFLSDDDTWPIYPAALNKHIDLNDDGVRHSMVCWGKSRLEATHQKHATWTWPRGVVLYAHRDVVWTVGGMDERFGPGGHEHVEWSNRIHNAGFTPAPFCSPLVYGLSSVLGKAMRAETLWHCEDMPKPGEPLGELGSRRRALTSVRREDRDWDHIHKIMAEHDGDAGYVPFRAHQNARGSATLSANLTSRGAEGQE